VFYLELKNKYMKYQKARMKDPNPPKATKIEGKFVSRHIDGKWKQPNDMQQYRN
jgi:hypothetical protein